MFCLLLERHGVGLLAVALQRLLARLHLLALLAEALRRASRTLPSTTVNLNSRFCSMYARASALATCADSVGVRRRERHVHEPAVADRRDRQTRRGSGRWPSTAPPFRPASRRLDRLGRLEPAGRTEPTGDRATNAERCRQPSVGLNADGPTASARRASGGPAPGSAGSCTASGSSRPSIWFLLDDFLERDDVRVLRSRSGSGRAPRRWASP